MEVITGTGIMTLIKKIYKICKPLNWGFFILGLGEKEILYLAFVLLFSIVVSLTSTEGISIDKL
jgi:hypothetical protein